MFAWQLHRVFVHLHFQTTLRLVHALSLVHAPTLCWRPPSSCTPALHTCPLTPHARSHPTLSVQVEIFFAAPPGAPPTTRHLLHQVVSLLPDLGAPTPTQEQTPLEARAQVRSCMTDQPLTKFFVSVPVSSRATVSSSRHF